MNINIMLLAMSTFPTFMKHCIASYGECGESYSYFSQLEPGCKHFIYKLGNMNIGFDKIVVLCTGETLTAPKDDKGPNSMPKTQLLRNGDKAFDISDKSPYVFFKERMISYIKNDDKAFEAEIMLGVDTEGITRFIHSELYSDPENLFAPVRVEKDEVEITSSIKEVIHIIDSIPRKENEKIFLYLNAQGGARKNVQIVNTVLNMLQSRKYSLSEVSVIEFNPDRNSSLYRMLDVTGSYLKNDLAAAMNAFLQYGRADMFVDYYNKYKKERKISTAPEDEIVKNINNISDAMLMCDIDGFLDCIGKLKASIKEYERDNSGSKDSFFEMIVEDIKKSYRELFDSDDMIADMDVLVDWCLKRKLLQQAVTILEAKTSDFVFDYGILFSKKDEETKNKLTELRRLISLQQDYKFNHPKFYIFNKFCNMNAYRQGDGNKYKAIANLDFADDDETFEKLVNGEYSFGYKEQGRSVEIRLYSDYIAGIDIRDPQAVKYTKDKMRELVAGYRKICYIRNDLNHGNIKSEDNAYVFIENQVRSFNAVLKNFKKISQLMEQKDRMFFEGTDIKRN